VSYDLSFRVAAGRKPPSVDELKAFLRARPHYEVGGDQALYQNEDTGVYFLLDFGPSDDDPDDDSRAADRSVAVPLAFHLNYNRPSVFALEAEPELAAIVGHFVLRVEDPQEGMADGTYSRDGFLEGWRAGNRLAVGAVGTADGAPPFQLPAAELERHWRWNLAVSALQAAPTTEGFVPRIAYLDEGGQIRSAVVWTDASPIALPMVDRVICFRRQLAPRRRFSREPDFVTVSMDDMAGLLDGSTTIDDPFPHRQLAGSEAARAFVTSLEPSGKPSVVPLDHVLDEEFVGTN
jgi:hypothetical protein